MIATIHDSLLRDILEHPLDDTPRLILADWLEENGQEARAEFIRLQAKECDPDWHGFLCLAEAPCRNCRLERRLLQPNVLGWLSAWSVKGWHACGGVTVPETATRRGGRYHGAWTNDRKWIFADFSRGFVERVEVDTATFLEHAAGLFAAHPITEVRLTRKHPATNCTSPDGTLGVEWHLWYEVPWGLPLELFSLLSPPGDTQKHYPGAGGLDAAIQDASRACVTYGRNLAKISPLQLSVSGG